MVSVPSDPTNPRVTGASATTITVAWGAPVNNGGQAIQSYELAVWAYDPSTLQYVGSNGTVTGLTGITGSTFQWTGLTTGYVYRLDFAAYNGQFYSNGISIFGIARSATALNQSFFETIAVSEAGAPFVTPPSVFGVALRLNQNINFIFNQLTSQIGRPDPDAGGADPYAVSTSLQPITRLALGSSDVTAQATDSEHLAGEIPSGTLASSAAVVGHTSGATSFTLTKAWVADRSVQIYTMAVLNNMPYGYIAGGPFYQASGTTRRTLIWTYDIPTPLGVANGDTFTTTVTIAF